MSLAPLKGVRGDVGVLTVTTTGPARALQAPARQDGLDRDRVAELIESLFDRPSTDGRWQFLVTFLHRGSMTVGHNTLALS
jgi:hypothetical protein